MFMALAITSIGIAVVLMVGYLIVGQVRVTLPSTTAYEHTNTCVGTLASNVSECTPTGCVEAFNYSTTPTINTSALISCTDTAIGSGMDAATTTVFAGFALVSVGIIVLAAFGLIQIFQ